MREEQFIKNNSNTWRELQELSLVIKKNGIKSLPSKDVNKFLHIFRLCSHDLAYSRTHYPESSVVEYLNSLISDCHSYVYAVKKISPWQLVTYISYGFPKLLKEYRWYVLCSFGIFAFGLVLSLLFTLQNGDNAGIFLPQNIIDAAKSGKSGGGEWNSPLMSSYIMVNNISISLKAFVLGITFGLGTIYVLFFNGAILGSLTGLIYLYGAPKNYWSLILPHGIIELTAIFISGAAGLLIAKSMLLPGEYSRGHSLIIGAKKAISLVFGIIFMLIIAGIIEGFFTPLSIPAEAKLLFAAITAIILSVYFSIPYIYRKH